jgi:hypothetical protein
MLGHLLKSSSIKGRSVLLLPFIYLGQKISVVSSYVFTHDSTKTERSQNDKNNKMREAIIGAIINNRVPPTYYLTERWRNLKQAVVGFLQTCSSSIDDTVAVAAAAAYSHVECIPAAGRGHNYDFTIVFTNSDGVSTTHHVEFKFNAAKVSDTPQFVSPMKPSQYLSGSYEEYFYDTYMPTIASMAAAGSSSAVTSTTLMLPDRAEWLKQIHNNAPACVKHLQAKYYAGCAVSSQFTNDANDIAFYETCKKLSCESIREFITHHDLDIVTLSEYLRESQDGKTYMLFQPASAATAAPVITLQRVNPADYTIVSCIKNPEKSRYECLTQSGKKIHVLLRWKNGNGIAFPAFQIS